MYDSQSDGSGDSVLCDVRDVNVKYERWGQTVSALRNLSLKVRRGEWLMIVGPNGSGKSTLLKVVSGRRDPDGGKITLNDHEVTDLSCKQRAREVFMVHQDPLLGTAASLTVFENLRVADEEGGEREDRELREKYQELLEPLGLEGRLNQRAQSLSGGERQLLALLIARLRHAPLILLDEPLASLDPMRSDTCLQQIAALQEEGKTLVHVTHNLEHAVFHGDRTVVLGDGEVVKELSRGKRTLDCVRNAWTSGLDVSQSDGSHLEEAANQANT